MVEYTQTDLRGDQSSPLRLDQIVPKTVLNITGKADGTNLILQDHARIFRLYNKKFLKSGEQQDTKIQIWHTISRELCAHMAVEETILYPLVAKYLPVMSSSSSSALSAGTFREEHDSIKRDLERTIRIVSHLESNQEESSTSTSIEELDQLADRIMRDFKEHVDKEESELIPAVRQYWTDQQLRLLYAALNDARSIAPHVPYPDPGWYSGPQTNSLDLLTESFIHSI